MNFADALQNSLNITKTENNADAYKTTDSDLLDLFGIIGSLRTRNENEIIDTFHKAFIEDKLLATKLLFYTRDIRNGLGERRTFRILLKYLAEMNPNIILNNINHIPFFGRYDDLFCLLDTQIKDKVIDIIKNQLLFDIGQYNQNKPISLLCKWFPSENASSNKTKQLSKQIRKELVYTPKQLRQILSKLRKYINLTESNISQKTYNNIDYSKVPSKAMMNYRNAFERNDNNRFEQFKEDLKNNKTKINSSVLFPYEILEKMDLNWNSCFSCKYDEILEQQWKALPNYINTNDNILIMTDTSGSMNGRPIHISLSLAIYFAERNNGIFKNKFMTFSSEPSFVEIKGDTIFDKIKYIPSIVANTDIEKAMLLILNTAKNNNISQSEIPKSLVIISDMEFDSATECYNSNTHNSLFDNIKQQYINYGYEFPNIVFWNVNARNNHYQIKSKYNNVQLASGASPTVFQTLINNIGKTPYQAMLDVLSQPRYDIITI